MIHRAPGALNATWQGFYADRHRSLDWMTDAGLREAARTAATGPLAAERTVVHGDYLAFTTDWLRFIPLQVAGRARIDVAGMTDRVVAAVRDAVDGMG